MSEPFIGEIRPFPYSFTPSGWLPCEGQVLPVNQCPALYALIGNNFGGVVNQSFQLPDLRGYTTMSQGQGPGLSLREYGKRGGSKTAGLSQSTIPPHNHSLAAVVVNETCSSASADATTPVNGIEAANKATTDPPRFLSSAPSGTMKDGIIQISGQTDSAGSGLDHDNQMPFIAIGYFIATEGIYPVQE